MARTASDPNGKTELVKFDVLLLLPLAVRRRLSKVLRAMPLRRLLFERMPNS